MRGLPPAVCPVVLGWESDIHGTKRLQQFKLCPSGDPPAGPSALEFDHGGSRLSPKIDDVDTFRSLKNHVIWQPFRIFESIGRCKNALNIPESGGYGVVAHTNTIKNETKESSVYGIDPATANKPSKTVLIVLMVALAINFGINVSEFGYPPSSCDVSASYLAIKEPTSLESNEDVFSYVGDRSNLHINNELQLYGCGLITFRTIFHTSKIITYGLIHKFKVIQARIRMLKRDHAF